MSLMRWNPYDPFDEMDQTMNRMMDRMRTLMRSRFGSGDEEAGPSFDANPLAIDMTSDENNIVVRTAIPGFKAEDVNIDVRGNVLTISAETRTENENKGEKDNWHMREMRYGKFARSVRLPETVKMDQAEASLEDGVLTVTLPKTKESPAQKISVKEHQRLESGQPTNGGKKR